MNTENRFRFKNEGEVHGYPGNSVDGGHGIVHRLLDLGAGSSPQE